MIRRALAAAAAVIVLGTTLSAPVRAHSPVLPEKADDLAQLAARSNLVVMGEVADVTYKNARNPDGGRPIPHSFVTFRVARTMRGRMPGEVLVLRFIGGPDGQGGFLHVDGVPLFQPGERDILFVSSNGERGCALALCEYGRYRVLGERVFNTHGAPVRAIVKDGTIARGQPPRELMVYRYPAPKFDELIKNPEVQAELRRQGMSVDDARRRYDAEAPKTLEITTPFQGRSAAGGGEDGGPDAVAGGDDPTTAKLPEAAISVDSFMAKIGEVTARTPTRVAAFRNADPNAEIVLSRAVPARALAAPRQRRAVLRRPTPAEAAEARDVAAQDGNPVLQR